MPNKILIMTVDCWNSKIGANTARTYSTLFSSIPEYELSNIYIREELPDDPCCKRYFQISENRIIKSLLKRKIKTGKEVFRTDIYDESDMQVVQEQKQLYNKQRKHFYYGKKMIRELIWFFAPWKSRELNAFLDDIQPDVIVYAMEGYIHFNRICRYAVKRTGAKAIGYFWDDNFTYKQRPGNIGYKVLRFFQRKSLLKLSKQTTAFWAISPKTKKEADAFFNIDCRVLSKPTEREVGPMPVYEHIEQPLRMFYAGNLMIGRLDTVKLLLDVLKEINAASERVILDIYTPTEIPQELAKFGCGVTFHREIPQNEVLQLQLKSDILLFAEDVVGKDRKVARLSFSTKIPDYLSCGKCILAIGDYDTAPMEYFIQEGVALCAQTKEEIKSSIEALLHSPEMISSYGKKAYECACKNHSKKKINELITNTIEEVLAK